MMDKELRDEIINIIDARFVLLMAKRDVMQLEQEKYKCTGPGIMGTCSCGGCTARHLKNLQKDFKGMTYGFEESLKNSIGPEQLAEFKQISIRPIKELKSLCEVCQKPGNLYMCSSRGTAKEGIVCEKHICSECVKVNNA